MKRQHRGRALTIFCALALLTSIGTSDAFAPSYPHLLFTIQNSALFAAGNSEAETATVDEIDSGGCGEGFIKATGEDGDCCVFDYESAAAAFGTAEQLVDEDYWEALDSQNQSRKKFGMDPLTPEQYVVLQAQIHQMEMEAEQTQQAAKSTATAKGEQQSKAPGFLQGIMKNVFQDTCETNFDCERPEVCCDFSFKKMCCSSGQTNKDLRSEYALIPVPLGLS